MPCAPARTAVSTAFITLGIPMSRVFLSNATLFTLTLSLVMSAVARRPPGCAEPKLQPSDGAMKNRGRYYPTDANPGAPPPRPRESYPASVHVRQGRAQLSPPGRARKSPHRSQPAQPQCPAPSLKAEPTRRHSISENQSSLYGEACEKR